MQYKTYPTCQVVETLRILQIRGLLKVPLGAQPIITFTVRFQNQAPIITYVLSSMEDWKGYSKVVMRQ
jgi:hypothetical protein